MDEELTDAPVEGSAFLRHFSFPFESLDKCSQSSMDTIVHPEIGCYKSTTNQSMFPPLKLKNPIEPKLNYHDTAIYNMIANYEDLLYCRRYPDDETIRTAYCAHALNHSLLSRKLMMKNNDIEKSQGCSDALRDQGFHRARILILVPTKQAARCVVHTLLRLMPKGSTVSHRRRFERDFGPQPGETDEVKRKGRKPKDYEDWFACNTADHFRIGIAFAKKTVKLYSAFAQSDLILASPLGLQTIVDDDQEKEADLQYITASTELLIVDQAEMLLMQNWANVCGLVSMLNTRPKKAAFASSARIRLSYLAGYGRRYRQSLVFSAVAAPLITLLLGHCDNFQGVNFIPPLPRHPGLYPSHLPDYVRIPGLKQTSALPVNAKRPRLCNSEVGNETGNELPEVRVNLLAFAVVGQAHSDRIHKTNELSEEESDPDDDYHGGVRQSVLKKSSLLKTTTPYGGVLVKRTHAPTVDMSYLAGRAVPMARMNAFKQRLLPRLRRGLDSRVLIYVPDFYDLEELRILLSSESLDFCCVHEYTDDNEAERFRTLFADGRIRILLLSERYYFFRRRKIRGARTFIFYGPPTFPWFVTELMEAGLSIKNQADAGPIQLNFLYYPPYEAYHVASITGKIDL